VHPAQIPRQDRPDNRRKAPSVAGNPRRRMTGQGDRQSFRGQIESVLRLARDRELRREHDQVARRGGEAAERPSPAVLEQVHDQRH
jgi:hypothetical protein